LLQKDQTLAYRESASGLFIFRALHSHIFERLGMDWLDRMLIQRLPGQTATTEKK
jgi:hypothetical protein